MEWKQTYHGLSHFILLKACNGIYCDYILIITKCLIGREMDVSNNGEEYIFLFF